MTLSRGGLAAALIAPLLAVVAAGQVGSGTPFAGKKITDDKVRAGWMLVDHIESGERYRRRILEAKELIGSEGLPAEFWDAALGANLAVVREHDASKRPALIVEQDRQAGLVTTALLDRLPPFSAVNNPNDDGSEVVLFWRNVPGAAQYDVERRKLADTSGRWRQLSSTAARGAWMKVSDRDLVTRGVEYAYRLKALDADGKVVAEFESNSVKPTGEWFHTRRIGLLALVLIISAAIIFYIRLARRGVALTIRKIAGLEAVDEAVGRATEMGKPILFVPGIQDMNDIQTVAGVIILGRVARVAATHDANLEVPTSKSLVMTASRETVQANYLDAGRPDAYDEKKVYYTTDEQFGYVAAVTGTMVREKPAACFYMGAFFAESLILAETGNMLGAIQVAGTAQPAQLPFFVAACDYTLIGEEFFAASAYLSGDPQQLGSLKGQDIGKLVAMIVLCFGVLVATAVAAFQGEHSWLGDVQDWLLNDLLDSKA
ncbi:MAG: hypothetical protein KDA32_08405 [Phycisphaerales bacterium]|nr:hypothetical protein [Phycisphaerales bacterium]